MTSTKEPGKKPLPVTVTSWWSRSFLAGLTFNFATTGGLVGSNEIAAPDRKTFLIEEQAAGVIPYTTSVQINERAGMSYAAALRSIMHHDPDIVYISDLPDRESARAVPEYSLTGHLVLVQMAAEEAEESGRRAIMALRHEGAGH